MMITFYERNTQVYKKLLDGEKGVWVISYENPGSPFLVSYDEMEYMKQIPVPEGYISEEVLSEKRAASFEKRMKIIAPLIEDNRCIFDRERRTQVITSVSEKNQISFRTIQRYYYSYLAYGDKALYPAAKTKKKKGVTEFEKNCRWAINKFCYSSRKLSLSDAYYMMLTTKYTDETGQLFTDIPSFNQFKYYYYKKYNPIKKVITQKGLSYYQRNNRPLYGKSTDGKDDVIGCFEMDATIADIYLVSKYDRNQPIGRPVVYLAVDTVTQLICGVYVGFQTGEDAVMRCLSCAAADKKKFCRNYGIEITSEQWSSIGLPAVLISDRGREFLGKRTGDLCRQFGIECVGLPPYRPDLKGTVEKTFDILQNYYKPILKRKGVIEEDFQERGAPDYRQEAALNLYEFTQIMIHSILFYNSVRVLNGYIRTPEMIADDVRPISSELWMWYHKHQKERLVLLPEKDREFLFLPRHEGRLTRKGLEFKQLYYYNNSFNSRCALTGIKGSEQVTVAYDPANVNKVFLVENDEYIPFELTKSSDVFKGLSYDEVFAFLKREKDRKKELQQQEIQGKIECVSSIQSIAQSVKKETLNSRESIQRMDEIRNIEKEEE